MYQVEKIKKDNPLLSGVDTTESTKDGPLSTLIAPERKEKLDTTEDMDITSTEDSTSDQECQ
jgi:hypothetical protein